MEMVRLARADGAEFTSHHELSGNKTPSNICANLQLFNRPGRFRKHRRHHQPSNQKRRRTRSIDTSEKCVRQSVAQSVAPPTIRIRRKQQYDAKDTVYFPLRLRECNQDGRPGSSCRHRVRTCGTLFHSAVDARCISYCSAWCRCRARSRENAKWTIHKKPESGRQPSKHARHPNHSFTPRWCPTTH